MNAARSTIGIDNPRVRVTTWSSESAGATTGSHRHEYDYVVVPVTGGTLTVTATDGECRDMIQHAGAPYLGTAGTEHTVTAEEAVVFVEIELKGQPWQSASSPSALADTVEPAEEG